MRKSIRSRFALLGLLLFLGFGPTALAQGFVHPGLLNTEADFARMRTKAEQGAEPWASAYQALTKSWTGHAKDWVRTLSQR